MVSTGASKHALVIGADVMSSIIDYTDRTTCVIFGDGAGAAVVEASDDPEIGILDFENYVDGSGGDALCMPAGGSKMPASLETVQQRLHYCEAGRRNGVQVCGSQHRGSVRPHSGAQQSHRRLHRPDGFPPGEPPNHPVGGREARPS
jgi:3-oxoacyl-[acyl-carrier-protein] synthase III